MKLNDYRLKKGWSYTKLAEMTGASHATVCRRWCLGYKHPQGKIPAPKYMELILKLTNSEVQPNDFYQDEIN